MNTNKSKADETQKPPSAKTACSGELDNPENFPNAMYRGERIYFCTIACLRVFEQNPDSFMTGEIEHPIDDI
jgi:YHS domain-containing protein